ncbi:endonuclease/exonuclease/phosphatase family protein [Frisingicoccus sp.]|uniref:endonuclease/exonuclease/phosphatase family protein n=1 Tax=Frisingicoccus sp. TaxID=1918627 RepID=UPI003AB1C8EB
MKKAEKGRKISGGGLVLRGIIIIFLALILVVGGYVIYLQSNYYRIEDHAVLEVENNGENVLKTGDTYSVVTYNIGFGAYGPDYSFFMDTGEMKDGTKTSGKYGKAMSLESVETHTEGALGVIEDLDADFYLLQEVDVDADRSYHVNQKDFIKTAMAGYASVFANNFHSAYLFYPFSDPHGAVQAGLLNFSRYQISEAERRSYPVDNSFITKFTDLDRCFAQMRLPVEGGQELVLINSHMSAYDEGGTIRAQQLELLNSVMSEEYAKGNYVIVGGDFNHAMGEAVAEGFPSEQKFPAWVAVLTEDDLADGVGIVRAENELEVPTCRGADIVYTKGVNYTTVVDGFLVTDNVRATAENVDTDFAYSDHNPVKLQFELIK